MCGKLSAHRFADVWPHRLESMAPAADVAENDAFRAARTRIPVDNRHPHVTAPAARPQAKPAGRSPNVANPAQSRRKIGVGARTLRGRRPHPAVLAIYSGRDNFALT
jgi:hypothetical protein